MIARLVATHPLRAPALREIVRAAALGEGTRGIDVGCGPGLQVALLAEAIGAAGHVTGVDRSPACVDASRARAAERGLADRAAFVVGDMNALPFPDATFDWAWSCDCVGYPAGDGRALGELARVVRPGGRVIVAGWTSQALLPGHPLLEARLGASASPYASWLAGRPPEACFMRTLGAMREVGLVARAARTFVANVRGPLDAELGPALEETLAMVWDLASLGLAEADRAALARLCGPGASEPIARLADYVGFVTYTSFEASCRMPP